MLRQSRSDESNIPNFRSPKGGWWGLGWVDGIKGWKDEGMSASSITIITIMCPLLPDHQSPPIWPVGAILAQAITLAPLRCSRTVVHSRRNPQRRANGRSGAIRFFH